MTARIHTEEQAIQAEAVATRAEDHEATLLTLAMVNGIIAGRVVGELREEDFNRPEHRVVFQAVARVAERGSRVSEIAVVDELRRMDLADYVPTVRHLAESSPAEAWAPHALDAVKATAIRRSVLRACRLAAGAALDLDNEDPIATAYDLLSDVQDRHATVTARRFSDVVASQVTAIEAAAVAAAEGRTTVPTTGFHDLDMATTLGPGKLVILAARPGMGKSALAFNVACNVAENALVILVTLEMAGEELASRYVAEQIGASPREQAIGKLWGGDPTWAHLRALAGNVAHLSLYIADPDSVTMAGIEAVARQVAAKERKPIGMVFVDYLGLVDGKGENETTKTAAISRASKRLARRLRCPVWMLCQLNRAVEQRPDKRPMLADLRQSGAIEQDADIVMFVYREGYYDPTCAEPNKAEILLPKNRGGKANQAVRLRWVPEKTRFYNYEFTAPQMGEGGDYDAD